MRSFIFFVTGFAIGFLTINWRWRKTMDSMRTMRFGHKMCKVCRICAPNAKVKAGDLTFACPHGDVVPNKTKRKLK